MHFEISSKIILVLMEDFFCHNLLFDVYGIYSREERLNQGLDNQLNWYYFDVTDITTVNGEKNLSKLLIDEEHEILLDQCFDLEHEPGTSTEVITTSEKFLLNGQKMIVLENAVFLCQGFFFASDRLTHVNYR